MRGPLLPDEIYPAWAVIARERATRLQVRLWTLIANIEAAHNNLDAANMAFEELITLERDDEERYLEPAEMYANANRPAKALQYVRRAETAMAELGLELSQRGRLVRDEAVRLMDSPDVARRELPDQPS